MLCTGTQTDTGTQRMVSCTLIVELGVGFGEAQFPHLQSEGLGVGTPWILLSKLQHHDVDPPAAQLASATLHKAILALACLGIRQLFLCLCVFLSWTSLGDFPPFLFLCRHLFSSAERDIIKDSAEQDTKKRSIPGHPASPSRWPRAGQLQALQQ